MFWSSVVSSTSKYSWYYQLVFLDELVLYTWNQQRNFHSHVDSIEIHQSLALIALMPNIEVRHYMQLA
jgi:hypothetical protein